MFLFELFGSRSNVERIGKNQTFDNDIDHYQLYRILCQRLHHLPRIKHKQIFNNIVRYTQ